MRSYGRGRSAAAPYRTTREKKERMKYRVTIVQDLKYRETIEGTFTSLAVVQQFIEMVMKHFEAIDITISIDTEEEEGNDAE